MKSTKLLIAIIALIGIVAPAMSQDQASNSEKEIKEAKPIVYYFHAKRRCATCLVIEESTTKTVVNQYADKVELKVLNREEDVNQDLVQKYKISGQTLLVVKGDKVIDLTTKAFMSARTNPEKFEETLKSAIDSMI